MSFKLINVHFKSLISIFYVIWNLTYYWANDKDLHFGFLILFLCGYMVYDSYVKYRNSYRKLVGFVNLLNINLLYISGLIIISYFQLYKYSTGLRPFSLYFMLFGVYLIIISEFISYYPSKYLKFIILPMFFFLFSLPLPSLVLHYITDLLKSLISVTVVEILNILGIVAEPVGYTIVLTNGVLGVEEACSGLRSLQSSLMLAIFFGYLYFTNYVSIFIVLVYSIIIAVFINLIRTLTLSITAEKLGLEKINEIHDVLGYILMILNILLIIVFVINFKAFLSNFKSN